MRRGNVSTESSPPAAGDAEVLVTIEELARRHQVPGWVLAGLKVANKWGAGKQLTEAEFIAARDKWLSGPMGGGE